MENCLSGVRAGLDVGMNVVLYDPNNIYEDENISTKVVRILTILELQKLL